MRLVIATTIPFCLCAESIANDLAAAVRERYLDRSGLPSPAAYEQAHEIAPVPGSESFAWQVVFSFAYRALDVNRLGQSDPVHTDCYFIRRRKYTAAGRAEPVWDGRVYSSDGRLVVGAFTPKGEKAAGSVDERGNLDLDFLPVDDSLEAGRRLRDARYNPFTGLLWRRGEGGAIVEEERVFLPLPLVDEQGRNVQPQYRILRLDATEFALVAGSRDDEVTLARCKLDAAAERHPGYSPTLGIGCTMAAREPTVVFEVAGEIAEDALATNASQLVLKQAMPRETWTPPVMQIDGRFDEWRGVRGIADPHGDFVSYLQYNPDTDLLEFKVASDAEHVYFYTRVVGRHGNTGDGRDRYYFYVYIDADRNPATGYLPTRDDNCYHGVDLGDDCEGQYEFIGGRFVKTFFGFAGGSTEKDVLTGRVTLAPSWYSRHDEAGRLREGYKVEYVRHGDQIAITKDFMEGTTDDIVIGLSPDGSECEMRAALSGFLQDADGVPIIAPGQSVDLAAGVEASGQIRGNMKWGADSTAVIRGYTIGK